MTSLSELIRAIQKGDTLAVEELVKQFSGAIRHECAKFGLRDHADLSHSDLVQEVLLRVWTKIHQFRGGESDEQIALAFDSWIRKTARTTLSNLYRSRETYKRKPDQPTQSFDEGGHPYGKFRPHQSGPSSIFIKNEEVERLRAAMDQCLDDQTKEIVNRHVVEGQSFKYISEQMSITYDQVRYAFHGAHALMAKWLT